MSTLVVGKLHQDLLCGTKDYSSVRPGLLPVGAPGKTLLIKNRQMRYVKHLGGRATTGGVQVGGS